MRTMVDSVTVDTGPYVRAWGQEPERDKWRRWSFLATRTNLRAIRLEFDGTYETALRRAVGASAASSRGHLEVLP